MLGEPKAMNPRVRRLWRFFWTQRGPYRRQRTKGWTMGLLDKKMGRGKKAAGDVMGDASMRREGAAQEREGAAEDRAAKHEELAAEQRQQAAEAHVDRDNA